MSKSFIGILGIVLLIVLVGCGDDIDEPITEPGESTIDYNDHEENITDDTTYEEEETEEVDYVTESEANAEEYPTKPGAMLYDKTEEKFKGMNYHFSGELLKIMPVDGLTGMTNAFIVKNENGYIMPVFPPYEMEATRGDTIDAWGPLSGDGYESSNLEVDNVVGVTGAINATRIDINGETK